MLTCLLLVCDVFMLVAVRGRIKGPDHSVKALYFPAKWKYTIML